MWTKAKLKAIIEQFGDEQDDDDHEHDNDDDTDH
jgi:hypothetical protein